jgi:NADH-ubiquinone oxidoreductase chain 4
LTTFITPICILSNWDDIAIKLKYFLISFLVLETLQIAVFVVLDLFLFYIFFESVLIPLFFIIIIWGGTENKYRAAFLLFLYTLAGSLFMLLAILYIYQNTGSTDFVMLSLSDINSSYQKILWLSLPFSKKDMTNRLIQCTNNTLNFKLFRYFYTDCKSIVIYGYNLSSTLN